MRRWEAGLLCLLSLAFLAACRTDLGTASWRDVSAAFSPDASKAAVVTRCGQPDDSPLLLEIHDLGAGAPKTLASDVSPAMAPVFSPDGSTAYYFTQGFAHLELMSVPAAGGEPKERASIRVSPQHIDCLRSSKSIAFFCFMEGLGGFNSSLKIFDMETGALREFKELPVFAVESAAISRDGRAIVVSDGRSLWRLDPEAPDLPPENISLKAGVAPLEKPMQLALSSDGSMLCLRLGRISSYDAGNEGNETADPGATKYKMSDKRRLVIIDLKGSAEPKTIASGYGFRVPVFSPDSKKIAFVAGPRLCVYDIASGKTASVKCPSFEYGDFLDWRGNGEVLCRVLSAPHSGARLMLVDAEAQSAPRPLMPETAN